MCKPEITDTIFGFPLSAVKGQASPSEVAGLFCLLSDEEMAEFFVAVDRIAETWGGTPGMQWWTTGRHLAECEGACGAGRALEEIYTSFKQHRDQHD